MRRYGRRYGVAVAAPAIATGLTALVPALGQTPFILFFLAVIVSAWVGGQGPSLVATVLSALAVDYFFLSPHTLGTTDAALVRLGLFALVGLVTGSLTAGRLRAEGEREAVNRQLQAVLDQSTAVVYIKDTDFRYLLVNRRYETLFPHVTRASVIGKTSHDVFPREQADRFRANDEQALRGGVPVDFEEVVPHDDGLHTYISLKFPLLDAAGRPYAVCGISTDITDRKRAAQLVAEHREWLRVTLSSIGDAVIATDTQARVTFVNSVAERLTGWSAAEAAGRPLATVFRIVNEDTRTDVESPVARVLREGQVAGLANHTVLLSRDGREIPIDDSGAPIRGEQGDLRGVVLVFREIAERRRVERDRDRQRREAELIVGVAASITASLDVAIVLERVADAARELCGADAARIALREADGDAMTFRHSVGRLAGAQTVRLVAGKGFAGLAMASGRPLRTANVVEDPRAHQDYLWLAHADGTTAAMVVPICIGDTVEGLIYLTNRAARPFTDADEAIGVRLAGYAAIALGNSRLFAREQAARAEAEIAERRATFLAEASRVLAGSLDYERTLHNVAHLAVPFLADWCAVDVVAGERTGAARVAVTHRDPALAPVAAELARRYPIDLDNPSHPIARVLRAGHAQIMSEVSPAAVAAMARDGEHLTMLRALGLCSYVSVPLQARGRTFGALSFAFGPSDRRYGPAELAVAEELGRRAALAVDNARLYHEAESVNRAKDEFLATLSHELRTPLHAMLGWARMLRSGSLDAAATARGVDAIERNTRLQAQLIEDLLDVSRIITGKLRLDSRPVDLAGPIDAAIEAVRPAADAKSIAVHSRIDPEAGPILGDPSRLQQVVGNLLSNAIKFTPRDGRVSVSVDRVASSVRLQVSDTGKGISDDFLPFIFERFRQADSTITRAQGGLGLGLAIVRHLVELHGGSVTAASDGEGRGTTFTVSLPVLAVHAAARADGHVLMPTGAPALPLASLGGVRVLVVDDEPDARDLVGTLLVRCGADVVGVGSTAEALETVERWRPDIVVSDIGLPGEDGYALIRKLRGLAPERGGDTPALALTAYARDADQRNALDAGYQAHLAKPVELSALAAAVAELARPRTSTEH